VAVALVALTVLALILVSTATGTLAGRTVASANSDISLDRTYTEEAVSDAAIYALQSRVPDRFESVVVGFSAPNRVEVELQSTGPTVRLSGEVGQDDTGSPTIEVQRINGVPLPFVGTMMGRGFKRGFSKGLFQTRGARLEDVTVEDDSITIDITAAGIPDN
jgi:hypothetical protein